GRGPAGPAAVLPRRTLRRCEMAEGAGAVRPFGQQHQLGRELVRGELTGQKAKSSLVRADSASPLLAVDNLSVRFPPSGDDCRAGDTTVVAGVSYDIAAGRTLGVVGESGCGKSMTALALLGLVPAPGRVAGSVRLEGAELLGQSEAAWGRVRGARMGM